MEPRVTVLLPTHNRADVLGYAIRSVLWQTEQDFELLIVGDGCTDNTADVVASFQDARIRWFGLPKAPLSGYANRNIALRGARGRYVAYAQHDDIWFPDHLERLVTAIEASGTDWVYSLPLWVMPDGVVILGLVNLTHHDELDHFLHVENRIPSTFVMHSRHALERVGYWPENIAHIADWRCWQRIITTSRSRTAGYCAVPTALHFCAAGTRRTPLMELRWRSTERSALPQSCRIAVSCGETEQRCFFDTLAPEPCAWIDQVRAAIPDIIGRQARAWAAALESEFHISESRWNSRSALVRQLVWTLFRKSWPR
ncbi:MAG: glycosyltransferase [Rhizobiales bacterium]|nr:glycosyltransferase [Hyphomicrobiales bacterium]